MTNDGPSYHFAYYCSGHGFGHATRVVAITAGLISRRHRVSIVSSASESVFEDVVKDSHAQASYRFAIFEPTVVQPKAYDRQSVIEQEREWLLEQRVDCVIIDAPFLPCAAASQANIPSVIISNFTFDSCYSYLAAFDGEEGTELLLRLPGAIPIPGFDDHIELPATTWIDDRTGTFTAEIDCKLARPKESSTRKKKVIDMPLIPPQSLLPPGWIAIICGLPPTSRPQDIPDGFFSIANSKFNYVPDLTAIADVVLGKWDMEPAVKSLPQKHHSSVTGKMFVEEYGLKRLMKETNTINVEMSIKEFEDGRWASFILLADDLKNNNCSK
ncbi:hypothetical protein H4Q26_009543 [Puccinia striiformis f. sp. tritici PST-130]|nr:hypothetical protein H4Q26_009543 [Puccinia striiformis f. sp. tritici PST-130]